MTTAAPLHSIRVLDLTRYLAGPFCTMLLSDYGADVVRVESPKGREFRNPVTGRDSYFFLSSNRGKRSITVDCCASCRSSTCWWRTSAPASWRTSGWGPRRSPSASRA
jgi:crotonobetainyl-CoA:carnitine CoA-transferase CaiB-like acyl-CoA transferase